MTDRGKSTAFGGMANILKSTTWIPHVLAWLGLILVSVWMYPSVWSGQADFYFNDIVNLNLPQRQVAAEIWNSGEVPLWNRYSFGGQPLLAAMQAGVLYPLNALYLWLHPQIAMDVSNIMHIVLAGGFMFVFLYGLWRRAFPAWVGGVIFMTCGFFTGHIMHTQMMDAVAWIPLILHFLEQIRKNRRVRDAIGLTVSFTLQILAGHPQIVFYTGMIVFFYIVYTLIRDRGGRLSFLLKASGGLLLAGLLSAMQLLPTMSLIQRTFREEVTYEFFSAGAMTPAWLGALITPFRNGGGLTGLPTEDLFWEYTGYAGIVATMLAGIAVIRYWRRDWHVPFFAGIGLLGLIVALGDITHASEVAFHIPGVNWFRIPARYVLFFDIAVAVLAAKGLCGLLEGKRAERSTAVQRGLWLIVPTILLVGILFDYYQHTAPLPKVVWWVPMIYLIIATVLIFVIRRRPILLVCLLGALILNDNVTYVQALTHDMLRPVTDTRYQTLPGSPEIPDWIAIMQRDPGRFRVASFHRDMALDRSGRYQLEALNGYDSLFPKEYEETVDLSWSWSPLTRSRDLMDLLNVKYVVARHETGVTAIKTGQPFVQIAAPTNLPVKGVRFTYRTNLEEPSRAPLARVTLVNQDGQVETYPWNEQIARTNTKPVRDLRIDYTEWREQLQITKIDWIGSTGQVLATSRQLPLLAPPWKELYRDDTISVLENQTVYPRYWVSPTADNPRLRDDLADVRETDYQNREYTVDVTSSGGWLVVSQLYDPGWVAYIDGQRSSVQEIGEHLTGIPLFSGTHQVRFRYEPKEWTNGLTVSGCGLILLVLWVWWARRKRTW